MHTAPFSSIGRSASRFHARANGSSIAFVVDKPSDVVLSLYDVAGRRQRTLLQGPVGAGRHDVSLTTADLPTGVYFVRLTGRRVGSEEGFEAQRKVVVQN